MVNVLDNREEGERDLDNPFASHPELPSHSFPGPCVSSRPWRKSSLGITRRAQLSRSF